MKVIKRLEKGLWDVEKGKGKNIKERRYDLEENRLYNGEVRQLKDIYTDVIREEVKKSKWTGRGLIEDYLEEARDYYSGTEVDVEGIEDIIYYLQGDKGLTNLEMLDYYDEECFNECLTKILDECHNNVEELEKEIEILRGEGLNKKGENPVYATDLVTVEYEEGKNKVKTSLTSYLLDTYTEELYNIKVLGE